MPMNYCGATDPGEAERSLSSGALSHAQVADTLEFLRATGWRPAKLRELTGYRDYTIRHYLRIAKKLVPAVKALLHRNSISFSMARAIASLPAPDQEAQARNAMMTGTSVHRLRRRLSGDDAFCDEQTSRYFARLANMLSEQTGLVISIAPDKDNKRAGTVVLRYTDLQDFDSICARLNVDLSEL